MLTPEQIGNAADAITPVYERLEEYVINKLAANFAKNANEWTSSSATLVMNAEDIGMTFDEIMQEVSRINNLSAEQAEKIISSAGVLNIVDEDKRLANIDLAIRAEQIPFLNQVINEYINQANAELMNITRTQAMGFTYQTASGIKFQNLSGYYTQKLDEAALGVRTGIYTANEAIKTFVKDVANSGLKMQYPSGYLCDVDVAARRAILTGVSQMAQKQNEDIARELDMPYAEVTAHQGARPTHQVWQGRIFKIEGSEPGYPNLYEATGLGTVTGLLGANCRHQWHPWDKGLPRVYTDEQLKNIDPPPITYNGKEYSYYDCTQRQRALERAIRKKKREVAGYTGANDTEALAKAKAGLKAAQKEYSAFGKAAGLKTKSERTAIYDSPTKTQTAKITPTPNIRKKFNDIYETYDYFGAGDPNSEYTINFRKALSQEQLDSVNYYTTNSYYVNGYHRTGSVPDTYKQKVIESSKQLDSVINSFELKDEIAVTRYSGTDILGGLTTADEINKMLKGAVVRDKAYLSTKADVSFAKDSEFGDVRYEIIVPKGKGRGAYIAPISNFNSENEFIIKRNADFEVLGAVERNGSLVIGLKML